MTTKRKVSELSQLASKITKAGGGKSSVKIGDAREVVRILVEMQAVAQVGIANGAEGVVTPVDIISRLALAHESEVRKAIQKSVTEALSKKKK